jgi:hypothetical protein
MQNAIKGRLWECENRRTFAPSISYLGDYSFGRLSLLPTTNGYFPQTTKKQDNQTTN